MLTEEQYSRLVAALPLLRRAAPELAREVQHAGYFVRLLAGQDVFAAGQQADAIALLLSGVVRVYQIGETGRELTLYRFGLGESCILTANAILSQQSFPAVATVEQAAEAVMIPADTFRDWVRRYELWREFVFNLLSQRLAGVLAVVDEVAFRRLDTRVAALLLTRGRQQTPQRITHQEIASELGSSREVISRLTEIQANHPPFGGFAFAAQSHTLPGASVSGRAAWLRWPDRLASICLRKRGYIMTTPRLVNSLVTAAMLLAWPVAATPRVVGDVGVMSPAGLEAAVPAARPGLAPEAIAGAARDPAEPAAPLDEEIFITEPIVRMTVANNIVSWSSNPVGCPGGEFAEPCAVRRKPSAGGLPRTLYNRPAGPSLESNLAADASYVYWVNDLGQVVRLPLGATTSDSPTVLASREYITATGEIAVDNTYVYWTENSNSPTQGKVFRALKTGGARQLMDDFNQPVSQLRADGAGGVFYIVAGIFIVPDVLIRTWPVSGSVFTSTSAAGLVETFALDASTAYWAAPLTIGGIPEVRSAPIANVANDALRYTLASGTIVDGMAVDSANLYWHERNPSTGPIRRLSLSGGTPAAVTGNLTTVLDLSSTGQFLFWHNGGSLYRLATDAAALELDARVAEIELTQGIQNLDNTVPLIAARYTLARVYPDLVSSPVSTKPAMVRLYGTRGGAPLPGSPLLRFVDIHTGGVQRDVLSNSANFILPSSWTTGTVVFSATVSVADLFDTNPANNSLALTRGFTRKANLCVKFLPVATWEAPPYYPENLASGAPTPGFQPILDRLRTLWATENIRWYWQVPAIRKPAFLSPSDPFTMRNGADRDWLIFALWEHNVYDGAPDWCGGNNARTHYVAMINPVIDTGTMLGYASLLEPLSLVKMVAGGTTPFDTPMGGSIAAQELAHNYNGAFGDRWKHVPCGTPAGDDPHDGWPYPADQIGPVGPREFWGFDRRTSSIIQPDAARDFMGYCDPAWVSDYTWRGIMDATGNTALVAAGPQGAGDSLTASGWVALDETQAEFAGVYRTAAGLLQWTAPVAPDHAHAAEPGSYALHLPPSVSEHAHVTGAYALELLSAAETVLISQPVTPTEGTHGGDFTFFTTLPFADGSVHLRLTRNGLELARRTISPNAPVVSLQAPAAGAIAGASLAMAWTATDADGDPLSYIIQYSPDGAAWHVIATSHNSTSLTLDNTSALPGSTNARIRVIASDGANTGSATSEPFTLLGHAPRAYVTSPLPGQAYLSHETVDLLGEGLDVEDGPLGGGSLQWSVTGPASRSGSGPQLSLANLPPGTYTVTLSAADGDGQVGLTAGSFFVSPKRVYDGAAPSLDGYCDDAGYAAETEPVVLRNSTVPASLTAVRFAHAGAQTYVCFTGLPLGTNTNQTAGLKVDVDNSGGGALQTGDRVFYARRDGVAVTGQGSGLGGEILDAVPNGLSVAVSENQGTWNAELRIDDGRLGGWNHLVKVQVGHYAPVTPLANTLWPEGSSPAQPGTWGLAALGRQAQTITFNQPSDRTLGDLPFVLAAAASSGLPVSFTSNTPSVCVVGDGVVNLVDVGTCSIMAAQAGNGSYFLAGSVSRSFGVTAWVRPVYVPLVSR